MTKKKSTKTGDELYREQCREWETRVPETRASMGGSQDVIRHKTRIHEQDELRRRPFSNESKRLRRMGVQELRPTKSETHVATITTNSFSTVEPLLLPASHLKAIREAAKHAYRWDANFLSRGYEVTRMIQAISTEFEDPDLEQSRGRFLEFLRRHGVTKGILVKFRPIAETAGRLGA